MATFINWTRENVAWAAGLFEGDGCVRAPFRKGPRNTSPIRIQFKMTDRDVLEKFHGVVGGGKVRGPYAPSGLGKKVTFDFRISGKRAYAFLVAMWPFLCSRRQAQVATAMRAFAAQSHWRKLTRADVEDIRARIGAHGAGMALAKEYGVSDARISQIKRGINLCATI